MKKNRVELICNVDELVGLFKQKSDVRGFLQNVVSTVANHMNTDFCSIFFYDEYLDRLVMEGNIGLDSKLIGKVILNKGEGIIGETLRRQEPIITPNIHEDPHYKSLPGTQEEEYTSLLAVPIQAGVKSIGVLVVYHRQKDYFDKGELRALKTISSQLAGTLEEAHFLLGVQQPRASDETKTSQKIISTIKGQAIVPGIGIGQAYIVEFADTRRLLESLVPSCRKATVKDFKRAVAETEAQLKALQSDMEEQLSDMGSLIFSTHLLMLQDASFIGHIESEIENGVDPCKAIVSRMEYFLNIFGESDNPRLREKVQDLQDLGHRFLLNLAGEYEAHGDYTGQVIIARELLPSELVKITAQHVEGVVLLSQGASAHISILAKSLGVPLLYTKDRDLLEIPVASSLILDGLQGELLVNPPQKTLEHYHAVKAQEEAIRNTSILPKEQTITQDGEEIFLRATINLVSDLKVAKKVKARGIGLYRSEFPFLIQNSFPNEDSQHLVYKKIFDSMGPDELITLRTLDIGGDKILSYMPDAEEVNPFLGLRALRFLLQNKKIFVGQLKAMIRAGEGREFRIMFPLVSSLDDFLEAKKMVDKSIEFLKRDGFICQVPPELGVMVELPSAVMMAPDLARESDFMSIGSNDLVQYLLGVDRTNEKVADLYETRHPAVLRSIAHVAKIAKAGNCPLSVCGNMTTDKSLVYFLLGLGITNLSLPPGNIPSIQQFVEKIDLKEAEKVSKTLLKMGNQEEIDAMLDRIVQEIDES